VGAPGEQRKEVGRPIVAQHDRLAVEDEARRRQRRNRLGDAREGALPASPRAGPEPDVLRVLAGDDAIAVPLEFMNPAGPGRHVIDQDRKTRRDEAGRPTALP